MLEHRWLDKNAEAGTLYWSVLYGFQLAIGHIGHFKRFQPTCHGKDGSRKACRRSCRTQRLKRLVSRVDHMCTGSQGQTSKRLATWLRNLKQKAESSKVIFSHLVLLQYLSWSTDRRILRCKNLKKFNEGSRMKKAWSADSQVLPGESFSRRVIHTMQHALRFNGTKTIEQRLNLMNSEDTDRHWPLDWTGTRKPQPFETLNSRLPKQLLNVLNVCRYDMCSEF